MDPLISIVDYSPVYAKAFKDLNLAWIASAHEVEEDDERVLSQPEKYILEPGGAIIIALYNDEPVGTCALRKVSDRLFEMTKMTVSADMRGKAIGRLLGEAIIRKARELGGTVLELYSNRGACGIAIGMYFRLGFTEVPVDNEIYKRADIKMRLPL